MLDGLGVDGTHDVGGLVEGDLVLAVEIVVLTVHDRLHLAPAETVHITLVQNRVPFLASLLEECATHLVALVVKQVDAEQRAAALGVVP